MSKSVPNTQYVSVLSIICATNISRLKKRPASTILVRSPVRARYFFLLRTFIPALGPTHPPIRWVSKALPIGEKRPGVWTQERQSNYRFKNEYNYTSNPHMPPWLVEEQLCIFFTGRCLHTYESPARLFLIPLSQQTGPNKYRYIQMFITLLDLVT